jgi:poly(3-hydroxybutyrate) depolymerase
MVEHAIAVFAADRRKVFVTGLSAGGAMATVMLATYPELFAGGAVFAGFAVWVRPERSTSIRGHVH